MGWNGMINQGGAYCKKYYALEKLMSQGCHLNIKWVFNNRNMVIIF